MLVPVASTIIAIIVEATGTNIIDDGWSGTLDKHHNLIVSRIEEKETEDEVTADTFEVTQRRKLENLIESGESAEAFFMARSLVTLSLIHISEPTRPR